MWSNAANYWSAAADGHGMVWAWGQGPLARYDPARDETATWSVDDDVRFFFDSVVPSHAGGVWLVAGAVIRRFDGSGFGVAYDLGTQVTAATEAPDGSVWAANVDKELFRLAGAEQTRIDTLAPAGNVWITGIAVDIRGDAWCAWSAPGEPYGGWLARYDGTAWRVYDGGLGSAPAAALTALPDGSVWAEAANRLARFDGTRWTLVGAAWPASPALAAGPDGALWVAAGDRLGRYASLTWRPFASIGDLVKDRGDATSVVPTRAGVFVAAGGTLYRRAADGWQKVVAAHPAPPAAPEYATTLLGVSHDEAWIGGFDPAGTNAVWHAVWHEGAWSVKRFPTQLDVVQQLLRAPDGSLWATDDQHAASVLAGSTWTSVGTSAGGLALDRQGMVWVAASTGGPVSVRAYALEHGAWVERDHTPPTDLVAWPVTHIGVGRDGAIWVAGTGIATGGPSTGLFRYAGGSWAMVDPLDGRGEAIANDLVVAPNGDLWIAGYSLPAGQEPQDWIVRFDGRTWAVFHPQVRHLTSFDLGGWYVPSYTALAIGPDGTVWVAGQGGLNRYDRTGWSVLYPRVRFTDVSVADDGTVWVIGPSGAARLSAEAARR